jgi:hypothetical protein
MAGSRTLFRALTVGCLLSASGWNGSVGLSARATCGSPSPTDLPSDGCPKMREPHDSCSPRLSAAARMPSLPHLLPESEMRVRGLRFSDRHIVLMPQRRNGGRWGL